MGRSTTPHKHRWVLVRLIHRYEFQLVCRKCGKQACRRISDMDLAQGTVRRGLLVKYRRESKKPSASQAWWKRFREKHADTFGFVVMADAAGVVIRGQVG